MTAPFTKIAPDALTRFREGDEQALERIFRDEYDTLTALAASESGDPACAPRMVEGAFYEAWQKRSTFTSPGDLEYFIRRCIHQSALREQGHRAALHHFTEHEGVARNGRAPAAGAAPGARRAAPATPANVDEAWAQLSAVLHAPPSDGEHAAHVRHDLSRHDTAQHVAHIADRKTSAGTIALMIGVAAAVVLLLVYIVPRIAPSDPVADADAAISNNDTRLVATQPGLRANVELADGSRALLGPDTRLRIPPGFGERTRAVGVEGTAQFRVAPENDRVFIVRAGNATVTASGTEFAVSAYPGAVAIVRVREGQVEVIGGGETRSLREGEAAAVAADGKLSTPNAAALDEAVGWLDGNFVVNDRSMRDLPALLQRWYGLDILVADSSVLDRKLSFRVPLDSTRRLISMIEQVGGVKYASQGGARVFRDARK
ncbi:MAG TPA: FecR domain-containing protein [Gemmatimonadaceae bacterium]|nr:FecR domain-containing protein [Gemmatimonadaceae bacterium]